MDIYGPDVDRSQGLSIITDSWPLTSFSISLSKADRWLRMQRAGRERDVITVRGGSGNDPWRLLGIDLNDFRIIGVTHKEWGAKLIEAPLTQSTNARDCYDLTRPLDYSGSLFFDLPPNRLNACLAQGFAYPLESDSWYGASPPPSATNIRTARRTLEIDKFGRVTFAEYKGDANRSDDDICIETLYAEPGPGRPRVLNALASRRVTDCGRRIIYSSEMWEYDGLPSGSVKSGNMTAHWVDRRATDNGAILKQILKYRAQYDAAGNVASLTTLRDGATRSLTFAYDPFGLIRARTEVAGTGVGNSSSETTYDPLVFCHSRASMQMG